MVLTHEAQQTLILLAQRRLKDPNLKYWGKETDDDESGTCYVCGIVLSFKDLSFRDKEEMIYNHGMQHLKEHNLLALI